MAFISKKMIYGKSRFYLEESVRLPSGKSKKHSIYLKDYDPKKNYDLTRYNKRLRAALHESLINFAITFYEKSSLFDAQLLKRLEEIKIEYKTLTKSITPKQWRDIIDRFTVNFT